MLDPFRQSRLEQNFFTKSEPCRAGLSEDLRSAVFKQAEGPVDDDKECFVEGELIAIEELAFLPVDESCI